MTVVERFILIIAGITLAGALGYLARRRRWLDESWASPLMLISVIFGWTPASLAVLWQLSLEWSLISLPIIGALVPILLAVPGYGFSKLHNIDRKSTGTFIVAFGIANIGFTMGGFVCYVLFNFDGLAYANLFAASWIFPYVFFYFPLAKQFGDPDSRLSASYILRTFVDVRSLPIVGSIVGLLLNLFDVPYPRFLSDWHIVDLLIILSVLTSFAIIGLQLHFSRLAEHKSLHLSLAFSKFILTPLIMLPVLVAVQFMFGPLPELARNVVYVQAFMPTAVFTVIISNLFDLNPRLAAALFLINTILFLAVVLPLITLLIL